MYTVHTHSPSQSCTTGLYSAQTALGAVCPQLLTSHCCCCQHWEHEIGSWHRSSYRLSGLLLRTNGGTRAPYSWLRHGLHPAFTTHSTLGGTRTWMPLTAGALEGAFICTWLRVSKPESRCLVSFAFYGVIVNARIWAWGFTG